MNAPGPAPASLGDFQREFARALLADDPGACGAGPLRTLVAQPGFAVYRNTVASGCVDALRAAYPTVRALVGDEAFAVAALAFSRAHPPRVPMLLDYGAGFGDFLAAFPPAAHLPWLADVARAERLRTEAHAAADEDAADARRVAGLGAARIGAARLRPHASARWAWFERTPVASIVLAHLGDAGARPAGLDVRLDDREAPPVDLSGIAWRGEGVLAVRPRDAVASVRIGRAACAFLDACGAGESVAHAAAAALAADASADLALLMSTLLGAGAFGALEFPTETEDTP